MTSRARLVVSITLMAAAALLLLACGSAATTRDAFPTEIAGQTMSYSTARGDQLPNSDYPGWLVEVANHFPGGLAATTVYRGYLQDQFEYKSDIIEVRGATSDQLLRVVLDVSGLADNRRTDQIDGKAVVRGVPRGEEDLDHGFYFYGFDDAVIILVASDARAREALRQLP